MSDDPETGVLRAYAVHSGSRFPTGASAVPGGINFCIFCRHATRVELLLYEAADSPEPFQIITLAADSNRTFFYWHVMVEALPFGTYYTWRADGPRDTQSGGYAFDPDHELLDPYARAVSDVLWTRPAPGQPNPIGHATYRAIVTEPLPASPALVSRGLDDAIIYELHVGGFTRHASSGVEHPGTFAGLIEKIPYLTQLGVTHVELLPVMAFDAQDVPPATAARGLSNYWGAIESDQCRMEARSVVVLEEER